MACCGPCDIGLEALLQDGHEFGIEFDKIKNVPGAQLVDDGIRDWPGSRPDFKNAYRRFLRTRSEITRHRCGEEATAGSNSTCGFERLPKLSEEG